MRKKVAIVYTALLSRDGQKAMIGGIQTYILRLAKVVGELGWDAVLFQVSSSPFDMQVQGLRVIGVAEGIASSPRDHGRLLAAAAQRWIGVANAGMVIFATDALFVPTLVPSIAIQHGVSWDLPSPALDHSPTIGSRRTTGRALLRSFLAYSRESSLNAVRRALIGVYSSEIRNRAHKKIMNLVCVDYNYFNSQRAAGRFMPPRIWFVPNHAVPPSCAQLAAHRRESDTIRILFARRFVWYRGTRLVAPVLRRILDSFPNVRVTFAGEGPDEAWLRAYFAESPRVSFCSYSPDDALQVGLEHDIALVPSLGSEGTSLSALEAMAARCAVVATCVGGLAEVLIDRHNGRLVAPDEESLFRSLRELCSDSLLRERLAHFGHLTIQHAFTYQLWAQRWREILLEVARA